MDGYANAPEATACPHCGAELRRGMIRCRDCGQSIVEATPEEEDFALRGAQLVESQEPKCALCGATLEPGSEDCPSCTSSLLDQLLKGPASEPPPPGSKSSPSAPPAKLHVQRARYIPPGFGTPEGASQSTSKLREFTPRAPEPETPQTGAKQSSAKQTSAKQSPPKVQPPGKKKDAPKSVTPSPAPVEMRAPVAADEEDKQESTTTTVETSAACTALLASLEKADATLRCEIATALGKLGDKMAMISLERHLGDQDIRVRRAVAGALVLLGHPKGNTLLDIAERKPAASIVAMNKPIPKAKSPRFSGGSSIDSGMLVKVGGAIVAIGAIAGGIWYWMNMKPSKPKKPKPAVKKVIKPAAQAKPGAD